MKPTIVQTKGANFLFKIKKGILEFDCRMGKSFTALLASRGFTVIVCPPSLKENWEREVKKWGYQSDSIKILKSTEKVKIAKIYCDTLIIDECHKFMKWKTSESLLRVTKRTPRVYLLTATLIKNNPLDLYWPLKICGVWPFSKREFMLTFCGAKVLHRNILALGKPTNIKKLQLLKKQVCFQAKRKLNLKTKYLSLGPSPLEAQKIEDFSLFQNLIGLAKLNHPKTLKIINKVLQKHKKVLIFYFHKNIEEILNKNNSFANISGKVPIKKRHKAITNFKQADNACLFINYVSCGEGLDIIADACIFIEKTWSSNTDYQAFMRAYGFKRDKPLYLYFIEFEDENKKLVSDRKSQSLYELFRF